MFAAGFAIVAVVYLLISFIDEPEEEDEPSYLLYFLDILETVGIILMSCSVYLFTSQYLP